MGEEFQFGGKQELWRCMVVMVVQPRHILNATAVHLEMIKMVSFMLSVFYHKKENQQAGFGLQP